ncbi:MAG: METTL5 family protein [Candidatus Thermoplasmatota archaeon]|nr:METTL5 family protein [Candidatus Thermoplasmatota archaeon]
MEQYPTDAGTAATILMEAYLDGNIDGKNVIDLGTGSGIFAIGAGYIGAATCTGIDVDEKMIQLAEHNCGKLQCKCNFIKTGVSALTGSYDTVIMNPPFGSVIKHDDLPFIKKAVEIGTNIYSIHNISSYEFISGLYSKYLNIIRKTRIFIRVPMIYPHHKYRYKEIESVLIYGIKN